ncbi:MAG: DUF3344 domain-containing protein, partial [Dehalococcoidia bacterium]
MNSGIYYKRSLFRAFIFVGVLSPLLFLGLDVAAQTSGGPSAFCHETDGAFTICPDSNEEWSDVPFVFFPESNSYLYSDQADLDPLVQSVHPVTGEVSDLDTFVLMYDECGRTTPLGPDEYFLVNFDTVEVEAGVENLERYIEHIFTDNTLIFIEDGVLQTNAQGEFRVEEIAGQRGDVGFGPSPNCPFDHVIVEFEIILDTAGGDSYSPDPSFWGATPPCDAKCRAHQAAVAKALLAASLAAAGTFTPCDGPCLKAAVVCGLVAAALEAISTFDPPDPNFMVLAVPTPPSFSPITPGSGVTQDAADAWNALLDNQAQVIGLLDAWLASVERAEGAESAGDDFWVMEQLQLAAEFSTQISDLLNAQPALHANTQMTLLDGGFSSIPITVQDIADFQADVAANGLPSSFVDLFSSFAPQAFGVSSENLIEALRDMVLMLDPNDGAGSFPEIMTDPRLIASTQDTAAFHADFARSNLPPPPPSATTLTPFRNVTIAGDYVAAGTGLRGTTQGSINISDIPAGATVTEAFLYWGMLDNVESPALSNMNFDGTPITGTLIGSGPDTCWGRVGSFAYRADVTSLVPGNGSYDLTGVASGFSTLAQGASLTVVYENPGDPLRQVILMDGNVVFRTSGASATTTIADFTTATPVSAKTTFAVGDGQSFTETASFSGGMGTANFSNPFEGSDGPLWDTDTFDVSAQLADDDMSAEVNISIISDCLMWVAQAFSVTTVIDSDRDGVLDELDNCPKTPNPDQADRNFNGIGDFCETGGDHSTAAFLEARLDGTSTSEPTGLAVADEPDILERVVRIVNFRVSEGLTVSAAELTANLVDSLVNVGLVPPEEADQLIDDVLANVLVPFADFTIEVEIEDDEFEVEGTFTLGAASGGIDPLTEDVTLKVGTFTAMIPAGFFEPDDDASFEFEGTIGGLE